MADNYPIDPQSDNVVFSCPSVGFLIPSESRLNVTRLTPTHSWDTRYSNVSIDLIDISYSMCNEIILQRKIINIDTFQHSYVMMVMFCFYNIGIN